MLRFRFNLETVLRWRESQAGLEEAKLRALLAEKERIRAAIAGLEQSEAAERSSVARADATAAEREGMPQFLRWAAAERRRLATADLDNDAKIAQQRARLIEVKRAHQLLVKLKDRQRAAWQKASDKELDDLAAEAYLAQWNRSTGMT